MNFIPEEFNPENIKAMSGPADQMYREETGSQEPMKSVLENNPEISITHQTRGKNIVGFLMFEKFSSDKTTKADPIG